MGTILDVRAATKCRGVAFWCDGACLYPTGEPMRKRVLVIEKELSHMCSNRPMAWRKTLVWAFARGSAALGLAAIFSGGPALAEPIALVATQAPNPASSFSLDFGAFGGVASARISQTDFALEIDADLGTAQFAHYEQSVDPLTLPGGISTGNIRVEVVPGSSAGTLNVLTGEFTTQELYAVHFDGDLSAFSLTSPVVLPSTSSGTVKLSARSGGDVLMAWAGISQLPNPFDPSTVIPFNYTCAVTAVFAPEPVTLLELALIPNVVNLDIPLKNEAKLLNVLDITLDLINANRERKAAIGLGGFISLVESQRGRRISEADADALVTDAEEAILLLQSSSSTESQQFRDPSSGKPRNSR